MEVHSYGRMVYIIEDGQTSTTCYNTSGLHKVLSEKKSRHKNYYSIYKTFKADKKIYALEVVYPGGEAIYHQTNYTPNS